MRNSISPLMYSDAVFFFQILNLKYLTELFKNGFDDLDDLVRNAITARMDIIVDQGV